MQYKLCRPRSYGVCGDRIYSVIYRRYIVNETEMQFSAAERCWFGNAQQLPMVQPAPHQNGEGARLAAQYKHGPGNRRQLDVSKGANVHIPWLSLLHHQNPVIHSLGLQNTKLGRWGRNRRHKTGIYVSGITASAACTSSAIKMTLVTAPSGQLGKAKHWATQFVILYK